jgi:hypothetical protein
MSIFESQDQDYKEQVVADLIFNLKEFLVNSYRPFRHTEKDCHEGSTCRTCAAEDLLELLEKGF